MIRVDQIIERESKAYLSDLVSKIDTKGVDIVVRTLKGNLVETLDLACKVANVDLILVEPRTNSIKEEVYLGKTSGKIIKQTEIPALIVPEGEVFKPFQHILMAVKCAIIKKEGVLEPLKRVKTQFKSDVDLLLVKTPYYNDNDFDVDDELQSLISKTIYSEKPTTYQGVLEHFRENNPDLLCIVRRKRGFFAKQWEKSTILKKDLNSTIPVLVLRGLK
jgi:hypothetical protein